MKRLDLLLFVMLAFMLWNFLSDKKNSGTEAGPPGKTPGQVKTSDDVSEKHAEKITKHAESLTSDLEAQLSQITNELSTNSLEKDSQLEDEADAKIVIPPEYIPQDLSRLDTREKLGQDLEYRREKLDAFLKHERKEMGPSQELLDKQARLRRKVHQKHRELLNEMSEKYKDEKKSNLR